MNLFSSLCVTADTSEKDPGRVSLLQKFIESNQGYFERSALKECSTRKESLDYLFEGQFGGKDIDLAIEFKTLPDFAGTWQTLEDRLPRAILAHKDVALIIEFGNPDLTDLEKTSCRFVNPAVRDGAANVLGLATYEAKLEEWTNQGVHVRIITNKLQFTTTILNLLYFVTKEQHGGLWLDESRGENESEVYKLNLINWLSYAPIHNFGLRSSKKLIERFGSMHLICSMSEDDLCECLDTKKIKLGKQLYKLIRYWHKSEQTPAEIKLDSTIQPQNVQTSKETPKTPISHSEQSNPELKYLDENKPKFIEVPKGYYQNGGEIKKVEESDSWLSSAAMVMDGSSIDNTSDRHKALVSGEVANSLDSNLVTRSQSSGLYVFPGDTPGTQGDKSPGVPPNNKEVIKSLEDAICDRVWDKPEIDTVIMREFMGRGYSMPEVHKTIKESRKLHISNGYISYIGDAKAKPDMDLGV